MFRLFRNARPRAWSRARAARLCASSLLAALAAASAGAHDMPGPMAADSMGAVGPRPGSTAGGSAVAEGSAIEGGFAGAGGPGAADGPASAGGPEKAGLGDSLPALIAQALARNPALRAAEWEVRARHAGPGHVWALDPPEVGVEFYQAPVRSFPDPLRRQQEIDYSVDQAFPFPGALGARIRAEHGHAEAGEAELESLQRKVARDVKTAYYAAWLADRRLALNARDRSLMERLIAIARRQYEVGLGSQADILRAQAEATRLRMDSADREQERAAALADLNALLDRGPETPLRLPDSLEPSAEAPAFASIAAAVESAHPDLKAKAAEIRMRQAESDLARRAYWPGFKVGGTYKDMRVAPVHGGALQDYWSLRMSMDVPVAFWSLPRARAGSAQAEADLERARADYADARNLALAKARSAAGRARAARERLRLAREALLPQARQAYASALAAYQGGKETFAAVLDAYRGELAAEEGEASDRAAALTAQAELEEAAGMDWEALTRPPAGDPR